jgi:hypothetical protein
MPFKKMIAVYSENHTEPIELLSVKAAGTYSYHSAVKD